MSKNHSFNTNEDRTKNTFYDMVLNSAKETIEIKLTTEGCKALGQCFKDLKEIQPVVYDSETKKEYRICIQGEYD
jgi:hypothetical protein